MNVIQEIFVIDLGLRKHLRDCGAWVGPLLSFGEGIAHIEHASQTFKVLLGDGIEGCNVEALLPLEWIAFHTLLDRLEEELEVNVVISDDSFDLLKER